MLPLLEQRLVAAAAAPLLAWAAPVLRFSCRPGFLHSRRAFPLPSRLFPAPQQPEPLLHAALLLLLLLLRRPAVSWTALPCNSCSLECSREIDRSYSLCVRRSLCLTPTWRRASPPGMAPPVSRHRAVHACDSCGTGPFEACDIVAGGCVPLPVHPALKTRLSDWHPDAWPMQASPHAKPLSTG